MPSTKNACAGAIFLILLSASSAFAAWTGKVLAKNAGQYPSIAVGPDGVTHISALDQNSDASVLRHLAVDSKGKLLKNEIVDSPDAGWGSSIRVDSLNHIHIAYGAVGRSKLRYAFFDGTKWTITDVEDGGESISMVLDADGLPHISQVGAAGDLRYDSFDGTNWNLQSVGPEPLYFAGTSIVLDEGRPNISFSDGGRTLIRAAFEDGMWNFDTIAPEGIYSTLALDPNDDLHVLYLNEDQAELDYASHSGSSWTAETLVSNSTGPSLVIDAFNTPQASYTTNSGQVMYAAREASGWQRQSIALQGLSRSSVPSQTAITLDKSLLPHLAVGINSFPQLNSLGYAALYAPIISCQMSGLAAHPARKGGFQVTGIVKVTNLGSLNAAGVRANFHLSFDSVLDSGDSMLGNHTVGAVALAGSKSAKFSFTTATQPSGEFVIGSLTTSSAAVDSDRLCVAQIP